MTNEYLGDAWHSLLSTDANKREYTLLFPISSLLILILLCKN